MNSSVVREKFFQYFKDKGHEIIPSASVINKTDKNLMFTNAGMNQFRNIFTGEQNSKFPRVANSQKCLRVSGKHNDLEEVGVDTYHHTFFEMLGNWSFGDYFKKEIIEWSFELITKIYGLNKEDLYVSVFEGSKEDKTEFDKESFDEWKKYFSEDKIINGNKKDNFWEMGDTGPCGPCSEIHVDLRSDLEKEKIKGADLVNKDHPHVVEIWNLVFIQFDRQKDGSLKKLDKQYVDTGMGLERLCMALQEKNSTYETDFFTDIIKEIENISGKKYLEGDNNVDIGIRVISDHLRAIIFTILDGQIPSNTGSGYVIRRILRRAIRYGYTNLDMQEPFMYKLVNKVIEKYDDIYPSLKDQQEYIESIIKDEEKGFLKTLNQGLNLINELINSNPIDKTIKGDTAFKLYDTFGFPIDLTSLIASENNFKVEIANDNSDGQIVLSGKTEDLNKLILILKKNTIKNINLPVSAPFHCSLMNKATNRMSDELNKLNFVEGENKLISNVTANVISNNSELKDLLVKQIENRVRWRESVINMINNDVNHFIEIGPGKVLSGLVKRISKEVKIDTINNQGDIESLKI